VPFIRDEAKLAGYLDSSHADYLVTFPSWYPQLVSGQGSVFEAGDPSFRFEDNMNVYQWK
jgi:hypothetical protein